MIVETCLKLKFLHFFFFFLFSVDTLFYAYLCPKPALKEPMVSDKCLVKILILHWNSPVFAKFIRFVKLTEGGKERGGGWPGKV